MSRSTRSLFAGLGLAVLLGAGLTACATPAGSSPEPSGDVADGTETEIDAAWLDNGRMIGLVTQGSSTCVPVAGDAKLDGDVLEVAFVEPDAAAACTSDLVPRVTLVAVPAGVDPTKDLEIAVTGDGYHGDTSLDGVAGLDPAGETDYLPSAGWTDADGQFVILTWGSSTCVPVIEDVAATAAAEVTVTFQTPPENQACTMDMAPRGLVTFVDGLEDDSDVQLVLTGTPEYEGVTVPIYGSN